MKCSTTASLWWLVSLASTGVVMPTSEDSWMTQQESFDGRKNNNNILDYEHHHHGVESFQELMMTASVQDSNRIDTTATVTAATTNTDAASPWSSNNNNLHQEYEDLEMVEFWPFHKKNKTDGTTKNETAHNKTKDETCAAQSDCSACAVHSRMCHWCAHDNSCHSIGSIYGCITGVNCFSNDRCKRQEPDPIPDVSKYPRMSVVPLVVAMVVAGILFCCASFGYCLACGIKGAYDDLAEIAAAQSPQAFVFPVHHHTLMTHVDTSAVPETATTSETLPITAVAPIASEADPQENGHVPHDASYIRMQDDDDDDGGERSPLLFTAAGPTAAINGKNRRVPRHMQRCFNACTLCYVVTVAVIGAAVFGSVHYYPKVPEYSVCSDQVAWKSLIDSIAALKVDASFEILISVVNPNIVDAVLDIGKGTFKHNNAFVGTFEIPPAHAKSMSISDLMIIAKFTPEKYEALAIVEEYYRGKLILHIDTQASIRVPALFNYTYEVNVKDMIVNVNEQDDRSLCKCPTWDDVRNSSKASPRFVWTSSLPSSSSSAQAIATSSSSSSLNDISSTSVIP